MPGIVELRSRARISRAALAFMGLAFVVLMATMDGAAMLKEATGTDTTGIPELAGTVDRLTGKALPIVIAVAPLVCVGGALALQFGGTKRAIPIIAGSIGAVLVVLLAKILAA
jgi:hypothetical protein